MMITFGCILLSLGFGSFEIIQQWEFTTQEAAALWAANGHLSEVRVEGNALCAKATDWDPFFTCASASIPAEAGQCVRIRMRSDQSGKGQLFWTNALEGQYGGFDPQKVNDFSVHAGDVFHDIYVFPFWHRENTIRQLRLDLFEGGSFALESIAILKNTAPMPDATELAWDFSSDPIEKTWIALNQGRLWVGPPMAVDISRKGWISLAVHAREDSRLVLHWSTSALFGEKQETVYLQGDSKVHLYHVDMHRNPQWTDTLVALNLEVSDPTLVSVKRISLCEEPDGPPELEIVHFGFENGVPRANRPESILVQIQNRGGGLLTLAWPRLTVSPGITMLSGPDPAASEALRNGDTAWVRWQATANQPGTYTANFSDGETDEIAETRLTFLPFVSDPAAYVPEPLPIQTSLDILAYYFPGWNSDAKYDCIRYTAPIRKPLLGYYDEGNPECVDWQIKWAVENGISCFLVDWYWTEGRQSLTHWFEAYRQARYRDYLQVAIMWANHNPPGTHSLEDWRKVTREWIDRYFSLKGYKHINGKPAVFLWDSDNIRNDLGGSQEVKAAFDESQEMARAAGYAGIEFIILQHHLQPRHIENWIAEGYAGQTSYHEFGTAAEMAAIPACGKFEDIIATSPASWEKRREISGPFPYYPAVDTGWDSRPWHGANAMAFHGRTVDGFKTLLTHAKAYCMKYGQHILILGPLNEWGEGSYIEPNLEFGFGMYEAIRQVFGKGDSISQPDNLAPRDVNRGPYDFPKPTETPR